eukprot:COSAG04_NODE_1533_length_6438_cov_4.440606_2_plen_54_part_00
MCRAYIQAKSSKEEVARLHAALSQQKKLVEEQKKMIVRCTLFAHEFRPVTQTF